MLRSAIIQSFFIVGSVSLISSAVEWKSGIEWPEPPVITAEEGKPPSDAIVLFDGKDMSQWAGGEKWEVKDGVATSKATGITSKQKFGDVQVHIEWASPEKVTGAGQGRGNSGLYFMGKYEVQILDSHDNKTYHDGQAAAIYKQSPPLVNASRKPGEWQVYDIVFHPAKFAADGKVERPATITVLHNGVLVQDHFEILGNTEYDRPPAYEKLGDKGPLSIQFHGNPVRFRNIWVRELKPLEGKRVAEPGPVSKVDDKKKDEKKKDDKKKVEKPNDEKKPDEKSDAPKSAAAQVPAEASLETANAAAREFFAAVAKKDQEKARSFIRKADLEKAATQIESPTLPAELELKILLKDNQAQVKVTNPGFEAVGLQLEFADGRWWIKF